MVAAFWLLINDGKREKARELVSVKGLEDFSRDISAVEEYFASHPLQKIKIESEEIENGTAEVFFTMYTGEKRPENENSPALLVKEWGKWKFEGLR